MALFRLLILFFLYWTGTIACASPPEAKNPGHKAMNGKSHVFKTLFEGVELSNWQQIGDWEIENGVVSCVTRDERPKSLHYTGRAIPGNCEIVFEWRSNPVSGVALVYSPELAVGYGLHSTGKPLSTYGASIDYGVSHMRIRLHTRNVKNATVSGRPRLSGFLSLPSTVNYSKRDGEWNRGRLVCNGTRVQLWLNNNVTHDVDLKDLSDDEDDSTLAGLVASEWATMRRHGLYLTVIVPASDDDGRSRHVQVRGLSVRSQQTGQ
jgi:hypothetical protein